MNPEIVGTALMTLFLCLVSIGMGFAIYLSNEISNPKYRAVYLLAQEYDSVHDAYRDAIQDGKIDNNEFTIIADAWYAAKLKSDAENH